MVVLLGVFFYQSSFNFFRIFFVCFATALEAELKSWENLPETKIFHRVQLGDFGLGFFYLFFIEGSCISLKGFIKHLSICKQAESCRVVFL
mmetsp:Transcript_1032/g.1318  ORF Transcript_1032/g.1318 Transcript_1032/m.1318 type:complete len:91 (-) Transcript_1032:29-301(-)